MINMIKFIKIMHIILLIILLILLIYILVEMALHEDFEKIEGSIKLLWIFFILEFILMMVYGFLLDS